MLTRKDLLFVNSRDLKVGVAPRAEKEVAIRVVHTDSDEELGNEKEKMEKGTSSEDSNRLAPSVVIGSGSSHGGWEPPAIEDDDNSKEILAIPYFLDKK